MTTDNTIGGIQRILENLSDEDKKKLAALLTTQAQEDGAARTKKRKQKRGGKATANKPVKRQKKKKQHRGMGEGTGNSRIARTESIELGQTLNLFDTSVDKDGSKKDVKIDKLLWGDNKPVPRLGRKPEFVTATCSKCEFEFEQVPMNICYQDDEGLVFCCDDCGTRR